MSGTETALLLVDIQNDFCEGGALEVPNGSAVVPVANELIAQAIQARQLVIASRDWHPVDHCSFEPRGGPWPPHCVQDSHGAAFHPDLELPDEAVRVSKGTAFDTDAYSAFDGTELDQFLKRKGITNLTIAGLALDVCVRATVLEARELGFNVELVTRGARAVDEAGEEKVVEELRTHGVTLS